MIRWIVAVVLLGSLAVLGWQLATEVEHVATVPPVPSPTLTGSALEVRRVIDGDTLVVITETGEETVRLLAVDTPERGDCYAPEATRYLAQRTAEGVRLEEDVSQPDRDRYGRLLRYVFIGDENLNFQMLQEGVARRYDLKGKDRYAAAFDAAEIGAREAGIGLWGACGVR